MPDRASAARVVSDWRARGDRVVFTNGCFDLLHVGHVTYLAEARALGQRLVVGLNDDESVRRLKGVGRPLQTVEDRAAILEALQAVDLVVPFAEDTPLALVQALRPDVIVKGGDYSESEVVGSAEVVDWGGEVRILPFVAGRSTTGLVQRMRGGHAAGHM